MQEMRVQSPGWEDPLEKEMATHSSILAWRIPWTEEPGGLQSTGLQSWTRQHRCTWTSTSINNRLLSAQDWFLFCLPAFAQAWDSLLQTSIHLPLETHCFSGLLQSLFLLWCFPSGPNSRWVQPLLLLFVCIFLLGKLHTALIHGSFGACLILFAWCWFSS